MLTNQAALREDSNPTRSTRYIYAIVGITLASLDVAASSNTYCRIQIQWLRLPCVPHGEDANGRNVNLHKRPFLAHPAASR
jgi:hypothetical protein